MTFLAYLAEEIIVHLIDWFIGGLAGWLIGRGGKGRGFGIALVIIYGIAVIGMLLGDGARDYFGPATAIIAFVGMLSLSRWRRKGGSPPREA